MLQANNETDVKVKGATAADNDFFEEAVKETEKVTGDDVENAYVDGAYQSETNREFTKDKIKVPISWQNKPDDWALWNNKTHLLTLGSGTIYMS